VYEDDFLNVVIFLKGVVRLNRIIFETRLTHKSIPATQQETHGVIKCCSFFEVALVVKVIEEGGMETYEFL